MIQDNAGPVYAVHVDCINIETRTKIEKNIVNCLKLAQTFFLRSSECYFMLLPILIINVKGPERRHTLFIVKDPA